MYSDKDYFALILTDVLVWFIQLYRAVIRSVGPSNQSYFVTFSDYGNTEEVSVSDVRPILLNAWVSAHLTLP